MEVELKSFSLSLGKRKTPSRLHLVSFFGEGLPFKVNLPKRMPFFSHANPLGIWDRANSCRRLIAACGC